jgi:hypothetical protein
MGAAGHVVLHSSSLSLLVDDPAAALSDLEQHVYELGGFVESASSYSSGEGTAYSSLSARVSSESLPALRQAALALAVQVQNDSTYSQDVTVEYRRLGERLEDLHQAEEQVHRLLANPSQFDATASILLLRDLLLQEKENIEAQLLNYDQRSALASISISFSEVPLLLTPVE